MFKTSLAVIFFILMLIGCQGDKIMTYHKDITNQNDEMVGGNVDKVQFKKNRWLRLHIEYDVNWGEIPHTSNEIYGNLMITDSHFKNKNKNGKWRKYYVIGHDKIKKYAIDCIEGKKMLYYSLVSDPPGEFGYTIDYKIVEVGNGKEIKINKKSPSGKYIYEYICKNNNYKT